jgi:hypothetical protein
MVRNPGDIIRSLHNLRLFNGTEQIKDLETTLMRDNSAYSQREGTDVCRRLETNSVWRSAEIRWQVRRFFDVFGRYNVSIALIRSVRFERHANS